MPLDDASKEEEEKNKKLAEGKLPLIGWQAAGLIPGSELPIDRQPGRSAEADIRALEL